MTEGLPLFAPCRDSETSREAARRVAKSLPDRWAQILAVFPVGGEMTADECATALGVNPLVTRPRFSQLHAGGWLEEVKDGELVVVRPSALGNPMQVYRRVK